MYGTILSILFSGWAQGLLRVLAVYYHLLLYKEQVYCPRYCLLSSTLVQGAGVLSQVLLIKNSIAWKCLKLNKNCFSRIYVNLEKKNIFFQVTDTLSGVPDVVSGGVDRVSKTVGDSNFQVF